ncbi:MAG: aspartate kinase [Candidatus Thorarchaeota archaeon]
MKFGGGCLRDPVSFSSIAKILQSEEPEQTVIVVSAVYGVTNKLEELALKAMTSEDTILSSVDDIRFQHQNIVDSIITNPEIQIRAIEQLELRLQKLERLLYGIAYTGEISDTIRVLVLSQGERLAAILLVAVLNDNDISSIALESDKIGLLTDSVCMNATVNLQIARQNLVKEIVPFLMNGVVPIITGFFGCTEDGKTSSFGRNGSDYSAAVIAHGLNAQTIHIWKDVDGFMTADPKIVEGATKIDCLSYLEAAELSYFGAQILHPRTVEPLIGTGTKIYIRNIRTPDNIGTLVNITSNPHQDVIKSVTFNDQISVLRIHGAGVGFKPGIIGEIGRSLSAANINIFSVLTSQTCINLLLDSHDIVRSMRALEPLVGGVVERLELKDDVVLIAVVGEGLLTTGGLAARIFSAVAQHGINLEMFAAGASEVAYYFIVKQKDMDTAIRAVHDQYY